MYIFGGQVDDFYLGDIVAMDMKTSKLPPLSLTPFLLSVAVHGCFIPQSPTRHRSS